MSARSTMTPSFAQMYCCLSREPQPACSRLNEMPACGDVAAYSLTGMETMPNVTVTDANARAAMDASWIEGDVHRAKMPCDLQLKRVPRTPCHSSVIGKSATSG